MKTAHTHFILVNFSKNKTSYLQSSGILILKCLVVCTVKPRGRASDEKLKSSIINTQNELHDTRATDGFVPNVLSLKSGQNHINLSDAFQCAKITVLTPEHFSGNLEIRLRLMERTGSIAFFRSRQKNQFCTWSLSLGGLVINDDIFSLLSVTIFP